MKVAEHMLGLNPQQRGLVQARAPAHLIDELLLQRGRLQRYGTVYERKDGRIVRRSSEVPEELEARRKAVDLLPADIELCIRRDINEEEGFLPW